jgi:hypothetical protein
MVKYLSLTDSQYLCGILALPVSMIRAGVECFRAVCFPPVNTDLETVTS